ncbi:MAG: hypothetical protein IJL79_04300 [Candidatus Methanomethylophilaceae archaeon]|nr:hypothetical protein [Candidatus Methanomethylophilaceae archaeon]
MCEREMTDEEFIEFINANKERMNALMGDDRDVKDYFRENAKKAKAKVEEAVDDTEDVIKKVFKAMFSPDVQKHIIGAGVEIALGISAALKAMPVPEKAQPIVDKMEEIRENAHTVYCKKNPDCPRKKSEPQKTDTMRIELD